MGCSFHEAAFSGSGLDKSGKERGLDGWSAEPIQSTMLIHAEEEIMTND